MAVGGTVVLAGLGDAVALLLVGLVVCKRRGRQPHAEQAADGSGQTRLTNNPAADEAATWSSDGRQLAFASNRDGDYDIYVMNADGSGQSPLTSNSAEDRWPSWGQ